MKKSFIALLCLFFSTVSVLAQSYDAVEPSLPLDVEKGTFRLSIEHDITGCGFTKLGVADSYENQMYALANLGGGLEYVYAKNRSLEINGHFAILGATMDWEGCHVGIWNATGGAMHRWYRGRWMFGAGLSFEYRHANYMIQRYDGEPPEYLQGLENTYGDNEFEQKHYNIGADLMAGWGKRKWWIGLRYSPRFIVKDVFRYKENLFPQLPVTKRAGYVDHQVALVIRLAFEVGKIKK